MERTTGAAHADTLHRIDAHPYETLTVSDVARICGVHRDTVRIWHKAKGMPAPLSTSGAIRWSRLDIKDWLHQTSTPRERRQRRAS